MSGFVKMGRFGAGEGSTVGQARDWEGLLWAESGDLADLLDELPDEEFDRPSLCEGWAVRDVVGHMLYGHTTGAGKLMGDLAKHRFALERGSKATAQAFARSRTPDELRAGWRAVVDGRTKRGAARLIPAKAGFTDHTIHHQDIRRPLGRARSIPHDRLVAALDAAVGLSAPSFAPKKTAKGLRFQATDLGWSHGDGALVRGPGESLLMATAGRKVALADLEGDGVATLAARLGA